MLSAFEPLWCVAPGHCEKLLFTVCLSAFLLHSSPPFFRGWLSFLTVYISVLGDSPHSLCLFTPPIYVNLLTDLQGTLELKEFLKKKIKNSYYYPSSLLELQAFSFYCQSQKAPLEVKSQPIMKCQRL